MSRALHVIFFMYPWVLTTGNLPPEILVMLTKCSISWLKGYLPRQRVPSNLTPKGANLLETKVRTYFFCNRFFICSLGSYHQDSTVSLLNIDH